MRPSPGFEEGSREWLRAELANDLARELPYSPREIYPVLEVLEETDLNDVQPFFEACAGAGVDPYSAAHDLRRTDRDRRRLTNFSVDSIQDQIPTGIFPSVPVLTRSSRRIDPRSSGWIAIALVFLAAVVFMGAGLAASGNLGAVDFAGLLFLAAAMLFILANEVRKPRR